MEREAGDMTVLKQLELELKAYSDPLKETADDIVKEGFSNYPILIAHTEDVSVGEVILDKSMYGNQFHFSATTLEQLEEHQVILKERKASFEATYNQNKAQYCVLLIHPEVMRFVFTPLKGNAE